LFSPDKDGTERRAIVDVDGSVPRPKICGCSISDPFAFIVRESDSTGLFIGETERGKIRRKDMSPRNKDVDTSQTDVGLLNQRTTHASEHDCGLAQPSNIISASTRRGAAPHCSHWLNFTEVLFMRECISYAIFREQYFLRAFSAGFPSHWPTNSLPRTAH
jgi:cleavage and polyadenylation specificity factor subunit 1